MLLSGQCLAWGVEGGVNMKTESGQCRRRATGIARKRKALAKRIRRVAAQMQRLGAHMNYYGGFSEIGQHGREMLGAANIARGWAEGIEGEMKNEE